ncbi:ATP-binding cassette domain-containing protein [Acidimicrobiaceae bacterium AH-315-P05]|nr:ATP-binding cassette domain-containing protein [Acidimicrobiaceae bacterium AH-315-P05]
MAGTGKLHLRDPNDVMLRVEDLTVEFPVGGGATVKAVSGISFDIKPGETLGLVGESGCGKSTTGKAIIQLPPPTSGSVILGGGDLTKLSGETLRRKRTEIQMIFQDPISSLNPRRKVGKVVSEPIDVWGLAGEDTESPAMLEAKRTQMMMAGSIAIVLIGFFITNQFWNLALAIIVAVVLTALTAFGRKLYRTANAERLDSLPKGSPTVARLLEQVGIDPEVAVDKHAHEFSGGQCQRISIARALSTDPKLLICDEPVSALDVSVQAQILNLLEDLKTEFGLTLVFIAHDLAVVKNISDRVAVMYLGKMCEVSEANDLYERPAHPYTALLLDSVPEPDPTVELDTAMVEEGDLPSPINPPSGCRFRTRCPYADDICAAEEPQIRSVGHDHFVACHHPLVEPVEVSLATD